MSTVSRTFTLEVLRGEGDASGIGVRVAVDGGRADLVAAVHGHRFERIRPATLEAMVASKQARTVLSPTRRAPIRLTEEAGVRLALIALATQPLLKPTRVEAIRLGIGAMSSEEALYWYAHATGSKASRALRSLRLLMADE